MENLENELGLREYGDEISPDAAGSAYLTLIKRFIDKHKSSTLLKRKVNWGRIESLSIERFDPKEGGVGKVYCFQITRDYPGGSSITVDYTNQVYALSDPLVFSELLNQPSEESFRKFSKENKDKMRFSTWESWEVYCDCIFPVSSSAQIYFGPRIIEIKRKPHNRGDERENQIINLDL